MDSTECFFSELQTFPIDTFFNTPYCFYSWIHHLSTCRHLSIAIFEVIRASLYARRNAFHGNLSPTQLILVLHLIECPVVQFPLHHPTVSYLCLSLSLSDISCPPTRRALFPSQRTLFYLTATHCLNWLPGLSHQAFLRPQTRQAHGRTWPSLPRRSFPASLARRFTHMRHLNASKSFFLAPKRDIFAGLPAPSHNTVCNLLTCVPLQLAFQ